MLSNQFITSIFSLCILFRAPSFSVSSFVRLPWILLGVWSFLLLMISLFVFFSSSVPHFSQHLLHLMTFHLPRMDCRPWKKQMNTKQFWISFCFSETDLGSEKLTSEKKLSSVRVGAVGFRSAVGVHVTSTVLTESGIDVPSSFK